MPDHQLFRRAAFTGDEINLIVTATRVLGMRDHWHTGRLRSARASGDQLAFVVGDLAVTGRDLDRASLDAGLADALFDFLNIDLDQLFHRHVTEGVGVAFGFKVGTGGADDAHAALL